MKTPKQVANNYRKIAKDARKYGNTQAEATALRIADKIEKLFKGDEK